MPAEFGSSRDYDKNGIPTDDEDKERWMERQGYVQMVKSAEEGDHVLSSCLGDGKLQSLSYLVGAYSDGKWGYYHKAVERLQE